MLLVRLGHKKIDIKALINTLLSCTFPYLVGVK